MTGVIAGATGLGLWLGFLIGLVNAFTGGGFAGFLSSLFTTMFICAMVSGALNGIMYLMFGGAAGSQWGADHSQSNNR